MANTAVDHRARPVVFTVPNAISIARLGLFAWFVVVLFGEHERVLAGGILAIAGTTDFLDGFLARRLNQVSNLGKVLDPTVDRLLLAGAVLALVVYGAVPIWLAALATGREVLVSIAVVVLAAMGAPRIDVLFLGKAGTFGLMVAFPLLLAGDGSGPGPLAARILAWLIAIPSLALALVAAGAYVPRARKALRERPSVSVGS